MGHDDNTMRSRAADKKIKNVSETTVGDLLALPTTLHVHTPARSHQTAVFFVFIFLLTGFEFQMTHIALVRHRGYKKEGGARNKNSTCFVSHGQGSWKNQKRSLPTQIHWLTLRLDLITRLDSWRINKVAKLRRGPSSPSRGWNRWLYPSVYG